MHNRIPSSRDATYRLARAARKGRLNHGAMPTLLGWVRSGLFATALASACIDQGDPRTIEGALAKAAEALARNDSEALFRVIDQRARHALAAIVEARKQAGTTIQKSYPRSVQAQALAELGDAVRAKSAAELFRMRCDASCLADLADAVGAPLEVHTQGSLSRVKTARGTELSLYHGTDTWYGIEWHTEALSRERDRAAAELELIQKNAALYDKRRALE